MLAEQKINIRHIQWAINLIQMRQHLRLAILENGLLFLYKWTHTYTVIHMHVCVYVC